MSSIYVACAGSSAVNGVYDAIVGGYENQSNNNYKIRLTGSIWEIYSLAPFQPEETATVYYTLTGVYPEPPYSTTGWVAVNGSSTPAPKTYEFVNGNTQISIEITNASSAVNGIYTWTNSIFVGGGVGTVSGYYKGSGASLIVICRPTAYIYYIFDYTGTILYGGDEVTFVGNSPPVSNYYGTDEYWTGYYGLTENPSSRVSVSCVGGGGGGTASDYFVYTKNNVHHIRKLSPQLGSEPTGCPDGFYPEGWFCCPGGGAALTAGDCDVPGPNYMASPPVTNFFIRKQQ